MVRYYATLSDKTGLFADAEFVSWLDLGTFLKSYHSCKEDVVMSVSILPDEDQEES